MQDHEIRIIGGKYKGKLLKILDEKDLRPTTNRVRETIFSWLNNIENSNVLDLFAGSGALGFEAYSRGAKKVTLVELNKNTSKQLQAVAESINPKDLTVVNSDALEFLNNCNQQFDIVFIDPPYKLNIYKDVLTSLLKRNLINENSIVYVEMQNGSSQSVPGYEIFREHSAGNAKYSLWKLSIKAVFLLGSSHSSRRIINSSVNEPTK